jgi:2-phospho-L-lactate guanylyltransferase
MRATIILPVKPFEDAKTRLAPILSTRQRADLSRRLYRHVLDVVVGLHEFARCAVVSRSAKVLDIARQAGADGIVETGNGLNAAIEQGMLAARQDRPILALCADLPLLSADDVTAMLSQENCDIAIAADRAGQGTNGLFMARPGLIQPQFGIGSCRAHQRAAANAGLRCVIVRRPGLAADIDTPADVLALAASSSTILDDIPGFREALSAHSVDPASTKGR